MDLHVYILWTLLLMFLNCNCEQETLNCAANEPNEPCTINCLETKSCKEKTLNCTANEPCTINCDSGGGKKACESTNIYQNNATNMTINCSNCLDCQDNHVHCGAGICTLNCGNSNAGKNNTCQDSQLSCGTGPCNIYCYNSTCNSILININSAISFQCTGDCPRSFPEPFPSTTQTPTIATELPTAASPTIATVTPTTIQSTTIPPTSVSPSVTSHSSTTFSTNNSISAPTNNSITTATNTPIIPSTTNIEHVIIATDVIMDINNSLWYIIGAVLFALICICCVIDLKKKYNSKSNISIKDYNDVVHTMHRQSTSLQKNELHKYDGNNTKHKYDGNNHQISKMPENNKNEIKVEGALKTFRYMDENVVKEINQSINHTVGIVEHDDMDVVKTVNVTQILMEYMDEGETLHC